MSASINIHKVKRIQVKPSVSLTGFADTYTTDIIITDEQGFRFTITAFHDPALVPEGDMK